MTIVWTGRAAAAVLAAALGALLSGCGSDRDVASVVDFIPPGTEASSVTAERPAAPRGPKAREGLGEARRLAPGDTGRCRAKASGPG